MRICGRKEVVEELKGRFLEDLSLKEAEAAHVLSISGDTQGEPPAYEQVAGRDGQAG